MSHGYWLASHHPLTGLSHSCISRNAVDFGKGGCDFSLTDVHGWMKSTFVMTARTNKHFQERILSYSTPEEKRKLKSKKAIIQKQIAQANAKLAKTQKRLTEIHLNERLAKLPADLRKTLATPAEKRDEIQNDLVSKFEKNLAIDADLLKKIDPTFKKESSAADTKVRTLKATMPPEPSIRALWDRGEPSLTYIFRRGESTNPGRLVEPGVPSVLTDGKTPFEPTPPWPNSNKTGRRLAFAKWLINPEHPLTARVMINRIWYHHFGRGIVKSLGNFGKTGVPPSHPELLDWLASEFVSCHWSVKEMHRLIMNSSAYRQVSMFTEKLEQIDPENILCFSYAHQTNGS